MTPIQDKKVEREIISKMQKGLKRSYPANWSAGDNRVGVFLNHYIRSQNTAKRTIQNPAGYNTVLNVMIRSGASKGLSQQFLNELMRQASAGNVPFWVVNPISQARSVQVENKQKQSQNLQEIAREKAYSELKREIEGPTITDRLFGGVSNVASSWGTAFKTLPWLLIIGGGAYLYLTFFGPKTMMKRLR